MLAWDLPGFKRKEVIFKFSSDSTKCQRNCVGKFNKYSFSDLLLGVCGYGDDT